MILKGDRKVVKVRREVSVGAEAVLREAIRDGSLDTALLAMIVAIQIALRHDRF